MKKLILLAICFTVILVISPVHLYANLILIGDSYGRIGYVDTDTANISGLFNPGGVGAFTDVAFHPSGDLYGITFDALYSIDSNLNSASFIGKFTNASNLNALVFDEAGVAYAMGYKSTELYTLDISSGMATIKGSTGFKSSGDLAFDNNGNLYLSALAPVNSSLISIDVADPSSSSLIGSIGYRNVYGLAFVDDTMYGASGTNIFEINLATGSGGTSTRFADSGLGVTWGASAPAPTPTPEPTTILLFGAGLAGLAGFRRKKLFKK